MQNLNTVVSEKRINLTGISLIAALAGFIFGFDTVVISGANLPIKELWNTSPLFHGFFIMSMALWGTVIGAIFGGFPTEKFGRKKVLLSVGILFSLSTIGTALATNPYSFSFFRFIGGLGIGISSVVAPIYISEISTPANRGKLTGMYQFNIVFGLLMAYISNYFLKGFDGANDWRWMLGVMIIPSLVYALLVIFVPESPRWLVMKNREGEAEEIITRLGINHPKEEVQTIANHIREQMKHKKSSLFIPRYKRILWLAFFIAFFNQWSGINFILYYAPEILERSGLAARDSLMNSILLGGINIIFTFLGLYLIDKLGRKKLLIIGSFGYIISLVMVAWSFYTHAGSMVLLVFLLLFCASHAIGQGTVIWVFISEIFPTGIRAKGQSFGASIHWVFAALITLITPVFLDSEKGVFRENPWPIFAFFAFMMVLQLIWVLQKVPETRGISLEALSKKLIPDK